MRDTSIFSGRWPLAHSSLSSSIFTRNWGFVQKVSITLKEDLYIIFIFYAFKTYCLHTLRFYYHCAMLELINRALCANIFICKHLNCLTFANSNYTCLKYVTTRCNPSIPSAKIPFWGPVTFSRAIQKIRTETTDVYVFKNVGKVFHWHPAVKICF